LQKGFTDAKTAYNEKAAKRAAASQTSKPVSVPEQDEVEDIPIKEEEDTKKSLEERAKDK